MSREGTSSETYVVTTRADRAGRIALGVGVLAAVLFVVAAMPGRPEFFRAYLTGYMWMLGLSNGCLGLMLLQHMTRGAWGVMSRRILEAGTRTLPFVTIAFLPVAFGLHSLYEWTHLEEVAKDPILSGKATWWLNEKAFLGRAAVYFAVWNLLSLLINRWSKQQDAKADPWLAKKMQNLSAAGIILYVVTTSLASFDWLMSLTPHWFSTIYGLYAVIGQIAAGMALISIMALLLGNDGKPGPGIPFQARHLHDYGKLLFAFCCIWAYFAFSQFIIIWSGNLPEETSWYVPRMRGAWKSWSILVVFLHYVLPFILLLSRDRKRRASRLAPVAAVVLIARFCDLHWLVAPAFSPGGFTIGVAEIAAPLALGGIWFWIFTMQLSRRSLIPLNEPFLQEALAHE